MSGAYLGLQDGLDYFDTPHGAMGVPPEVGAQMRGGLGMAADGGVMVPPPPSPAAPAPFDAQPPPVNGPTSWQGAGMPQPMGAPDAVSGPTGIAPSAPPRPQGADGRDFVARTIDNTIRPAKGGKTGHGPAPMGAPEGGPPTLESAAADGLASYDASAQAGRDDTALNVQDAQATDKINQAAEIKRQKVVADQDQQRAAEKEQLGVYTSSVAKMVDEHTKMEVDRGRSWNNRSAFQKALTGISVALAGFGGAVQGKGDSNPALNLVMAGIQQDVDDQTQAIAKHGEDVKLRQGVLQDYRQSMGDNEAARNAALARGVAEVEAQTKLAMSKTSSQHAQVAGNALLASLAEKRAGFVGIAAKGLFDRDMEVNKLAEQKRASRAQEGIAGGHLALAKLGFNESVRQFDLNMADRQKQTELDAAKLEQQGKIAEAKALRENSDAERKLAISDGSGKPLVDKTGAVYQAPDPESARDLRKSGTSAMNATRIIDQLVRARKKYGWSSETAKSDEWRQAQADYNSLIIEAKNTGELGALSGPDMDLVKGLLGTGDPTEMRDPTAGLQQARKNIVQNYKGKLKQNGYQGDFDIPPLVDFGKAVDSKVSTEVKEAMKTPSNWGSGVTYNMSPMQKRNYEEEISTGFTMHGKNIVDTHLRILADPNATEAGKAMSQAVLDQIDATGTEDQKKYIAAKAGGG